MFEYFPEGAFCLLGDRVLLLEMKTHLNLNCNLNYSIIFRVSEFGDVAQLAERCLVTAEVAGSSPVVPATKTRAFGACLSEESEAGKLLCPRRDLKAVALREFPPKAEGERREAG